LPLSLTGTQQTTTPLGYNRTLELVRTIEQTRTGKEPNTLIDELGAIERYDDFCARCEKFGVFSNYNTLEVDLFGGGYADAIIETLREARLGKERRVWVDEWAADNDLKSYAKSVQEQIDQLHDRWAV
jgi:putative ATP-dependent endonuclease of the OLD family